MLAKLQRRVEAAVAHGFSRLPGRAQLLLAGGHAIRRDGLTLDPAIQLVLTMRKLLRHPALSDSPPDKGRVRFRADARTGGGKPVPVAAVRDLVVDGAAGKLPARHYSPGLKNAPLLVFIHGGGFVLGDLDSHDAPCRLLCREGGMNVLSVEYRLAPEHPFPAATDDARAAFAWASAHAAELGADPGRIAVGGDSAGGNLAAVVAQTHKSKVALQLLLYPTVDRQKPYPSLDLFAEGFLLTRRDISWFQEQYLGGKGSVGDPTVSPLLAKDLAGLAPALVITAGFDPLRDEGEAYARALAAAGTKVTHRRFDSQPHGFINLLGVSRTSRAALVEIAKLTKEKLAR